MSTDLEPADPEELTVEQKYFDQALDCRERLRASLGQAPKDAAHRGAASSLRKIVDQELERLRPPGEAVAFGRLEMEDGERRYIGYNAIWDDDSEVLVVNWKTSVAAPYFEASYKDLMDVRARRTFECEGNRILSFDDIVFRELAAEVERLAKEPEIDDVLLTDLARGRTGEMQDIVKTIQAAQYQIIRAGLEQLLVVQGGAGTGKTAVGLHRVAWLLFNYKDRLQPKDVLVIGPNRTFIRYIRNVLPMLGDENVQHAELESLLSTRVRLGRDETPALIRVKGELRMERLLERGLRDRVNMPEGPVEIRIGERVLNVDRDRLERQVKRQPILPYAKGRLGIRNYLRELVENEIPDPPAAGDAIENLLDRIWPQMSAASFLQELLGSEGRLIGAAGEEFSAAEVRMLYRRAADRLVNETWSEADVPLLDYADFLIRGEAPSQHDHIVVDEAQDLSPLQLKMIARRSPRGSMTVLGDLAQSTGPWGRDSWDEVIEFLRREFPANLEELEFGYRVPRQVFEVAAKILAVAAPSVKPPNVVRDGPSDPEFRSVTTDHRASSAVEAARQYAASGHLVGIICGEASRMELQRELNDRGVQWADARKGALGSSITLMTAPEAKGLEFDCIVVVEPEQIAAEDKHGLRLLYVALTRTTRHLTIVHSEAPLPSLEEKRPISRPALKPALLPTPESQETDDVSPLIEHIADQIATQVSHLVRPEVWGRLLDEIRKNLDERDAD